MIRFSFIYSSAKATDDVMDQVYFNDHRCDKGAFLSIFGHILYQQFLEKRQRRSTDFGWKKQE